MFEATRFNLARRRRGFKKKDLALKLGVSERSITAWENGESTPTAENIAAIAEVTSFPVRFFEGDAVDPIEGAAASFRSMRSMRAFQRDQALATGNIALMAFDWISQHYELPDVALPDLSEVAPAAAAMSLRENWGLGNEPVDSMVELLEAHGVAVFSLVMDCKEVDAFSIWRHDEVPLVMLNTMKSAERSRFDAAHELGHLVMHNGGDDGFHSREVEKEANEFAAEFLMPRADVLAHFSRGHAFGIEELIELKQRWNVSLAALAHRVHQLGIIGRSTYENLCIHIQRRGYRTVEPEPSDRERSLLLTDVVEWLRGRGEGVSRIARECALPDTDVGELFFHLAPVHLKLKASAPESDKVRPTFRVIVGGLAGPTESKTKRAL